MKNTITLTKPAFEKLIEHLIYIEESADSLADFFFAESPKDKKDIKNFFKHYIKTIEDVMECITIEKTISKAICFDNINTFPFVIIDSEVELETMSGKPACVYRLINPDVPSKAKNGVTYLSSIGKALLLKNMGSEVILDESTTPQRLKIKSIRLI